MSKEKGIETKQRLFVNLRHKHPSMKEYYVILKAVMKLMNRKPGEVVIYNYVPTI